MRALAVCVDAILQVTESALLSTSDEVAVRTPDDVRSLLAAGEEGVACENLCANLYEYDIRPPRELLEALRRAVIAVGMDPEMVDDLM